MSLIDEMKKLETLLSGISVIDYMCLGGDKRECVEVVEKAITQLEQAEKMREAMRELIELTSESPPEFVDSAVWEEAVNKANELLEDSQ